MPNERIISNDFAPALSPGDGATSENGRVKQSELVADFDDVSYSVFEGRFYVSDRASDANNCIVWLDNKSGNRLGCVAGEKVYIYYASGADIDHMWVTDVVEDGGEPYISFSDADCQTPAVPAITYNAGAFIAAIIVTVQPVENLIEKDRIVIVGDGALTGTDLARSSADTTKIATKITTLETQADSVIETAGGLKANSVEASNIKKIGTDAAFENDLPKNVCLDGSCEKFVYNGTIAYGMDETSVAAVSYEEETTIVKHGSSSQKFSTTAGGTGVRILIDPEEGGTTAPGAGQTVGKDFAGKNLTLVCWYRADVANNVEIGFLDDSVPGHYQVESQTVAADTWTLISVTKTVPAGTTELYGIIRAEAATATDHYVDAIALYPGETAFEVGQSSSSSIVHNELDTDKYNLLLNGRFASDLTYDGTAAFPIGWYGSAATVSATGSLVLLELDNTDYMFQQLTDPFDLGVDDSFLTFIVQLEDGALGNAGELTLRIHQSGGGGVTTDNIIDLANYPNGTVAYAYVTAYIIAAPGDINVGIINESGVTIDAVEIVDAMVTRTPYPVKPSDLSVWELDTYTFNLGGSLTDTLMDVGGISTPQPVTRGGYVVGLRAIEGTTGTGTDEFNPRVVSAAGATVTDITNMTASLGSGVYADDAGNGGSDAFADSGYAITRGPTVGYLSVYCNADAANEGSDAVAAVLVATMVR